MSGTVSRRNDDVNVDSCPLSTGGSGGNSPPIATDDAYSILHDTTLDEPAPGVMQNDWDYDRDPLTASLVSGPAHAQSFTFKSDGSFMYEPPPLWAGTDGFMYEISDGTDTDEATVSINVTNNAPWTTDDNYSILHDTTLEESAPGVMQNDWDYEGDPITASLVTGPSHADSFSFSSDGSFYYQPAYHHVRDKGHRSIDWVQWRRLWSLLSADSPASTGTRSRMQEPRRKRVASYPDPFMSMP